MTEVISQSSEAYGPAVNKEKPSARTLSQRLRETAQIKKALSNLGMIIKRLSKGEEAVGLPFRDSILTWLLKVGGGVSML